MGLDNEFAEKKYLYIGVEADNLVLEGNREIETCKEYAYLGTTMNREGTGKITKARRIIAYLNRIL